MNPIQKKIVTDENRQPVAVQIDYADWLEIERRLGLETADPKPDTPHGHSEVAASKRSALHELAKKIRPHWQGGGGLDYQRRIRDEWTRPWDAETREEA